jgi:S1-C subfamily serine protease
VIQGTPVIKFIAIMVAILAFPVHAAEYSPNLPVDHALTSASSVEKGVRQAAVRVTLPFAEGHGSGSYIKYKDVYLVITAQHVVSSTMGTSYLVSHKEESHIGILIYSDPINDIGILYIGNPFRRIKPMKFNPMEDVATVGTAIVYSGYPSHHKLMSFVGRVAGHEPNGTISPGKHIILQTYGWFGCSGSIIYDAKGQQVGVLYGVDVEYYPNIQVQENMIWVVPINKMKIGNALKAFCLEYQGKQPKACK